MSEFFNSRKAKFKRPFGALTSGSEAVFCLFELTEGDSPVLCVLRDGESEPQRISMRCEGDSFCTEHIFTDAGLYFYWFELSGDREIRRGTGGEGIISTDGALFQQTVYSKDYRAPHGFAGGIMYQIFPDRFNIGEKILDPVFPERHIRSDIDGIPQYKFANGERACCDFWGGNLRGIREKLDYIESLGVDCIYLNPICEAHSNHRYNTADYLKVDPLLGTEEDFVNLCREAHERDIKIILDGVFNHTGDDSVYFNKYGTYPDKGAYQSRDSRYLGWYNFTRWPDEYSCWWGIADLPDINDASHDFADFICGDGGVIEHWISLGADGIRLDVADELSDEFIARIRQALNRCSGNLLLLGEVWEDASSKIAYGTRRKYLLGSELDSVMNYPFRAAILHFLWSGDAEAFGEEIFSIYENYPHPMLNLAMNMLGTHDTPRALNALTLQVDKGHAMCRDEEATRILTRDEYLRGAELFRLACALQFTLPGIPCIYYGDEIGMQGFSDPFCRGFMRWDAPNERILETVRHISKYRVSNRDILAHGELLPIKFSDGVAAFERRAEAGRVIVAVNRGEQTASISIDGKSTIEVAPWRYVIERL